jgi:REP element-mobilizing transposase RayT
MPHRETELLADHYYHVYNRGVAGNVVFFSPDNYLYFVRLLARNAARYAVTIVAYCLMPNHYHLLLTPTRDHNASKFMHSVASSYSQALNQRLGRQGPLFQGRFRAVWVDREAYLTHVARYIHANPVMAGLVTRAEAWPYSDYAEVIGIRPVAQRDGSLVPERFETGAAYREFVEGYVMDAQAARQFERYFLDL